MCTNKAKNIDCGNCSTMNVKNEELKKYENVKLCTTGVKQCQNCSS